MNIVFFSRLFYPHIGGVEKHVLKISSILIQKGHNVTVVTEKFDPKLKNQEVYQKIRIHRIPLALNKKKKYEIWNYLKKNVQIIKKADIVHVHDVFFWYLPFRLIYPHKKVFVTFHGYEGNDIPKRRAVLSHKIAELLSTGNICVGDFLKKWYGTKPDIVTYGGVDGAKTIKKKKSFKDKKILYIGRLEKEAGIMEYLLLVGEMVREKTKVRLVVIGDGKLREKAEAYTKKHKLPIVFKGFVKNTQKHLPNADLVFTSRYLGILEALSFRKPVFCIYNNAIKKDYILMSPLKNYICYSDSVQDLKHMLNESIKDPSEINSKTEKGYNWTKAQTWEKLSNQYLKLWKKNEVSKNKKL